LALEIAERHPAGRPGQHAAATALALLEAGGAEAAARCNAVEGVEALLAVCRAPGAARAAVADAAAAIALATAATRAHHTAQARRLAAAEAAGGAPASAEECRTLAEAEAEAAEARADALAAGPAEAQRAHSRGGAGTLPGARDAASRTLAERYLQEPPGASARGASAGGAWGASRPRSMGTTFAGITALPEGARGRGREVPTLEQARRTLRAKLLRDKTRQAAAEAPARQRAGLEATAQWEREAQEAEQAEACVRGEGET